MSEARHTIYILHGDDEYAIGQELAVLQARLGDAVTAEMNTTRLDGRTLNLDEVERAVRSLPFLAERRLVILADPLAGMKSQKQRDKLMALMEQAPPTALLVILITRPLVEARERSKGATHWLEKWARGQGQRVFLREYALPRGPQMARWIQTKARELGGEFSYQAAELLGAFVGDDPRRAVLEIEKLLAYVNYKRPVEADDVDHLTPNTAPLADFALVNAIRQNNPRQALAVLRRQLETDDPIPILHGITYQFRLMLLARSVLDGGGGEQEVIAQLSKGLRINPYSARLAAQNARQYDMPSLERIYRSLLELDEALKTGQMEGAVALDLLVAGLTAGPSPHASGLKF